MNERRISRYRNFGSRCRSTLSESLSALKQQGTFEKKKTVRNFLVSGNRVRHLYRPDNTSLSHLLFYCFDSDDTPAMMHYDDATPRSIVPLLNSCIVPRWKKKGRKRGKKKYKNSSIKMTLHRRRD